MLFYWETGVMLPARQQYEPFDSEQEAVFVLSDTNLMSIILYLDASLDYINVSPN